MLLQLDLDDLLALQDALPRLQPVQMLQLLALLQLQPFNVLELKRIRHEWRLTSNHDSLVEDLGSLLPPPFFGRLTSHYDDRAARPDTRAER
jgi:hypothetical protein